MLSVTTAIFIASIPALLLYNSIVISSGTQQSEAVKQHSQDMKTEIDEPNGKTHIQKIIVQFLARELGISEDRINFKRNFLDYGMDSILGRKLMRHIEKPRS